MNSEITLVDRGRGLQLSTSRVRVQDLVPYFQDRCTYEEIMRWIPVLTLEEISAIERHYRMHQHELDEESHLIEEHNELRRNPPQVEEILAQAHAERLAIMDRLGSKQARSNL